MIVRANENWLAIDSANQAIPIIAWEISEPQDAEDIPEVFPITPFGGFYQGIVQDPTGNRWDTRSKAMREVDEKIARKKAG